MELSERKAKILQAVVDDYIKDAQPLSSKYLQDKHMPDLSSATIRSELAALEEMGYLIQPHISAGRVPSAKAYRLYVEELMKGGSLTVAERKTIEEHLQNKAGEVEDIVRSTAKVISDMTNYTSVILLKKIDKVLIRKIKLVDLMDGNVLVVIITDCGVIKDAVAVESSTEESYFEIATTILNNIFSGKHLGEVKDNEGAITGEMQRFRELIGGVIKAVERYSDDSAKIYLEGEHKIFDYPEYNDIDKAKNFLTVVDTKEELYKVVEDSNAIEFSVRIDKDESGGGISDCSIVTAKYSIQGKEIGQAGVIGPTRMNYDKVFAVLEYISKMLNGIGGDNGEADNDTKKK